ncbi:NCS2 family permease [Tuberibacillus sp. Marseille-P3662]|uniref:NCS2 family permease n=1 Tax=Tuberibacillus sp. Marseille-P3662 TaxID=1965358 RepID=UPI000A1CBEFF|nr:NCS2 family permease [Tuberibacillus sp. Marseille-P3662]
MNAFFKFNERGTNLKQETLAGVTTFLAMAYIMIVNPIVLSDAGMDKGAVFTATGLTIVFGCLLMGILANFPIGVAPSMGLNSFFTYSVVINLGIPWENALTGVFIAAILFLILSLLKIREKIVNAIPQDLKFAVSGGIGFFIALIGLKSAGIIKANESTLVTLGDLTKPNALLAILGFILIVLMMVRGFRGAIFFGIIITTIVGILTGVIDAPKQIIGAVPSMAPTFGVVFDHIPDIFSKDMLTVIFTFLFVAFFDTAGTLIAIASKAGLVNKNNEIPNAGRVLLSDSLASTFGSITGTSTTASFIESTAGIAAGGRTGFTAIVIAILFALSLLFSPLIAVVTSAVTAPALIIVGSLMAAQIKEIRWDELHYAIPAFITIIMMPLTYSVANGVALGLIIYPLTMLAVKKHKDIHPIMYVLFVIFILYFAFV